LVSSNAYVKKEKDLKTDILNINFSKLKKKHQLNFLKGRRKEIKIRK
jgi:hypothetical protein